MKGIDVTLPFTPQSQGESFHDKKRKRTKISSSLLACIYGLHETSRAELWRQVKGLKKPRSAYGAAIEHGRDGEPKAAMHFLTMNMDNIQGKRLLTTGCVQCYKYPDLLCASPDRLFAFEGGEMEGLEIKCPMSKPIPKNNHEEEFIKRLVKDGLQCFACMICLKLKRWNLFYFDPRTLEWSWFQLGYKKTVKNKIIRDCQAFVALEEEPGRITPFEKSQNLNEFKRLLDIQLVEYLPPERPRQEEYHC